MSSRPFAAPGTRTNFTAGLHIGYFVIPMISLGTEVRYQQWIKNPSAKAPNTVSATAGGWVAA